MSNEHRAMIRLAAKGITLGHPSFTSAMQAELRLQRETKSRERVRWVEQILGVTSDRHGRITVAAPLPSRAISCFGHVFRRISVSSISTITAYFENDSDMVTLDVTTETGAVHHLHARTPR